MPEFAYTAKDRGGALVEGTVYADNSALAVGKVRELGLLPEKVRALQPVRRNGSLFDRLKEEFLYPVSSGVTLKELAVFYRQFATMIKAGIPLYQSLVSLETQTRNEKLRNIIRVSQGKVQEGGRLSEVFGTYPYIFTELQIEMIRAAEHGGMLDDMLMRIADYLEQELALRRLISRLTLYPKIVVVSALFILGKSFFLDRTPALSKLIVGSMGLMNYSGWDYLNDTVFFLAIILAIVFAIVAFCRISLFQSESAREGYERFKMSIPGLGQSVKGFALAKFGRAFGAMYAGGLPLNAAIRVAGNASGSSVIKSATRRAIQAAERGATLSQSFRETGVFPYLVIDMLSTGEQTGNLDEMMNKAAEYMENEASQRAHLHAHIFATVIYLLVAIMVAFAIISFYMGHASSTVNAGGSMGD